MFSYSIEFVKTARKVYLKLPDKIRKPIYEKLIKLAHSPFASYHDVKPLQGAKGSYRLRVGDWRIIYRLHNDIFVIEVIKIGHRKEVYQ